MPAWEHFEALCAVARREAVPQPEVTAAVRRRLAARPVAGGGPAWGLTAALSAVAVLLAVPGWQAWQALADPLLGLTLSLQAGWLL
ncbi:MAG: hypothetical protein IT204_14445 [Fimbriimonadaceae bacterium]|nr:hypothetical protein [Fimbriimonadaceae bacterium]